MPHPPAHTMKVLSSEEIQALDRQAIDEYGIPGHSLMEYAGMLTVKAVRERWRVEKMSILVLCGKGNNGGDGFVIGRHLHWLGATVWVILAGDPESLKGDALAHYNLLLKSGVKAEPLIDEAQIPLLKNLFRSCELIIDALFGTGLRNDVQGMPASLIHLANTSGKHIVAVDIPSGVDGTTGHVRGEAVRADLTVTMGLPKTGHMVFPGASQCGDLVVADIGFPPDLLEQPSCKRFLPSFESYRSWIPSREKNAHKGSAGKVLFLAGSRGYTGAAALASESALRTGAGFATLAIQESLNSIMEEKLTEVVTLPFPDLVSQEAMKKADTIIMKALEKCTAMAIGPGTGRSSPAQKLMKNIVRKARVPLVLDADALMPDIVREHAGRAVILTPHPGEMARLLQISAGEVLATPIECAIKCAALYRAIVVLKGAHSIIATRDGEIYFNLSGNEGMASAGMGDVLTGIIGSLLAQGLEDWKAAVLGVFIHGAAGDMSARGKGRRGILASDLMSRVPEVMEALQGMNWECLSGFSPVKRITTYTHSLDWRLPEPPEPGSR